MRKYTKRINVRNKIMFKLIPTLTGKPAIRFLKNAEKALRKRKSIDFSNQIEKMRTILKRKDEKAKHNKTQNNETEKGY